MSMRILDEYGIQTLDPKWKISISLATLVLLILFSGFALFQLEQGSNPNIESWRDGMWTAFMVVSTIGFGDFFPVTSAGRSVVILSFFIGAYSVGDIISAASDLRRKSYEPTAGMHAAQSSEIMRMLQMFQNVLIKEHPVDENSHLLDDVICQDTYESEELVGWITLGRDSSGVFVVSIDGMRGDKRFNRWVMFPNEEIAAEMYSTYKLNREFA